MGGVILVNHTFNVTKLLDMTRYINRTTVMKSIHFFCFFQQLCEQWMINVHHRYHKFLLLLLFLTYQHRNAPSRNIPRFLRILNVPMTMMKAKWKIQLRSMEIKIILMVMVMVMVMAVMTFISAPHRPYRSGLWKLRQKKLIRERKAKDQKKR